MYLTSLVKTDQEGAVNAAVKKRESLLASPGASAESSPHVNESPATTQSTAAESTNPKSQNETGSTAPLDQDSPTPAATDSQKIAQSVLAGNHSVPKAAGNTHSEFAAALEASQGKPIQVTIVERTSFRFISLRPSLKFVKYFMNQKEDPGYRVWYDSLLPWSRVHSVSLPPHSHRTLGSPKLESSLSSCLYFSRTPD